MPHRWGRETQVAASCSSTHCRSVKGSPRITLLVVADGRRYWTLGSTTDTATLLNTNSTTPAPATQDMLFLEAPGTDAATQALIPKFVAQVRACAGYPCMAATCLPAAALAVDTALPRHDTKARVLPCWRTDSTPLVHNPAEADCDGLRGVHGQGLRVDE